LGGGLVSKKDKLLKWLLSQPKDFTFDETKNLLELCGYVMSNSGKTSGSRVSFTRVLKIFHMHKPHPKKEILGYQINEIIKELQQEELL